MGPSEFALKAITENINSIVNYPDPDCLAIRQILSGELDVPLDNIICGNGAVELIFLLVGLMKPRQVLIPVPTFSEYEMAVNSCGSKINYLALKKENDFKIEIDLLINSMPGMDMVFICNPNNPTGQIIEKSAIQQVLDCARVHNTFVVIDESFMDFVSEREKYSILNPGHDFANLFVLYSLTKFYAIPGLRLGAGIGSKEIIAKINASKDPWNVNCLAQLAGAVSLQDREYQSKTVALVNQEKAFLFQEISKIKGFKPLPPAVNFIFIDISGSGFNSIELQNILGQQGILIRDCSSYQNLDHNYIRIAVKDRGSNRRLIEALTDLMR